METQHRKLINHHLSDLIIVTSNVEAIVNNLLEKNTINKWMKDHILVWIFFLNFFETHLPTYFF